MARRHGKRLVAAAAVVAVGMAAVGDVADAGTIRLRAVSAGVSTAPVDMCGKVRLATLVPAGARVSASARRRVRVERCRLGRWVAAGTRTRRGRRVALDASAPADLRVRSRGSRAVFVRIGAGEIVDVPVEFDVINVNTSKMPCQTDGKPYVVRGRMVAPMAALAATPRAATLFLHGVDAAGYMHLSGLPAHDLVGQLAARGHVTVNLDRLGYGASDRPSGDGSCLGGQASTAQQVVDRLRSGEYRATGTPPRAFQRVALTGHSGGGPVAQLAAYSFAGIDALVVAAWADQGFGPALFENSATGEAPQCGADPAGYRFVFNLEAWRRDPEGGLSPEVLAAAEQGRFPNPCGDLSTLVTAPLFNQIHVREVQVPVLLLYGRHDPLFTPEGGEAQAENFSGSDDVTLKIYEAGHSFFLEDAMAETAQNDLSAWLQARGL